MQRYIEQLIDDLRNAAASAPGDPFEDPTLEGEDTFMMQMEESEKIVEGPFELLCDVVGIPSKMLPSSDKLSIEQLTLLNIELEKLLNAYNYFPEYPDVAPAVMLYNAYRQIWDSEVIRVRFGHYHIDFCDGDDENCPFPGFCPYCNDEDLMDDEIPLNEFDIPAKDLSESGNSVEDDFLELEKDFYNSEPLTDEEGFIPGIHNYCDRWCERCDFTDKCRIFDLENGVKDILDREERGTIDNKEQSIGSKVDQFFDFDEDEDDDENSEDINLGFDEDFDEDFDDYQKDQADYFSDENKIERHPITELADSYSINIFHWLKDRFEEQEKSFLTEVAAGYADEIMEAENVVSWYSLLIDTKLRRALSGYFDTEFNEFAEDDMNGSAKVALIGIDRSIDALTLMIRHLKKHRAELKSFRTQLEKLRNMAEELFPEARQFIRPGLDEL